MLERNVAEEKINKSWILPVIIFLAITGIVIGSYFIGNQVRKSNSFVYDSFDNLLLGRSSQVNSSTQIRIINISSGNNTGKWNNVKATADEADLTFWTLNQDDKKTTLGWIPLSNSCIGKVDKKIYGEDGLPIKDDKDKDIFLKCETAKCGINNCYSITLTTAQAVNIDNYIRLGNSSSVSVYQPTQQVVFSIDDLNNVTATLYKNISGNFNNSVNGVFVNFDNFRWKFGAVDIFNTGLEQYKYEISSTSRISESTNGYLFNNYLLELDDICDKDNSNCQISIIDNNLSVIFWSNGSIDPIFSLLAEESGFYRDSNITFEGANMSHLSILTTPSSFVYNVSTINRTVGTDSGGTLANVQTIDGLSYNTTELVATPGLDVRMNFTGVTKFDQVKLTYLMTGLLGQTFDADLFNATSGTWVTIGTLAESATFVNVTIPLNANNITKDYIQSGIAQLRIQEIDIGSLLESLAIDYAELSLDNPYENLLVYIPFDEGGNDEGGNVAFDLTQNNNDAPYTATAVPYASGVYAGAVIFNATTGIKTTNSINLIKGNMTLTLWVNSSNSGNKFVV